MLVLVLSVEVGIEDEVEVELEDSISVPKSIPKNSLLILPITLLLSS